MLIAFQQLFEIEGRRQRGDYSDNVKIIFPLSKAVTVSASPALPKPSISLSELIDRYTEENVRAGNWSEKTRIEYKSIFRNILRLIGDINLNAVTMESSRRAKEVLLNLPDDFFRATRKYLGISAAEASKANDGDKLEVKTVNKYLANINALYR